MLRIHWLFLDYLPKKTRSDLPILVQVEEADPIDGVHSNKVLVENYITNDSIDDIELFFTTSADTRFITR